MMPAWLVWTGLTLFAWGLYGFLPKLATRYLTPAGAMPYYLAGGVLVGILGLWLWGERLAFDARGAAYASMTGAMGVIGGFCYLAAVSQGKLAVVVTLTALYPVVTMVLGFTLLDEAISLRQGIGIGLALTAMVLMTW